LRCLNAGNYAAVTAALELHDIAGGKVCETLEQRRVREAALWNELPLAA
jgi:GH24 family phage-related lysozyme (muramidase)